MHLFLFIGPKWGNRVHEHSQPFKTDASIGGEAVSLLPRSIRPVISRPTTTESAERFVAETLARLG